MTINTNAFTFNTGRHYSRDGQIIHVKFTISAEQSADSIEFGDVDGELAYYDETRGLYGKFPTFFDADASDAEIKRTLLCLYDSNKVQGEDITFEEALALKASA